jgi:hypothetical protein
MPPLLKLVVSNATGEKTQTDVYSTSFTHAVGSSRSRVDVERFARQSVSFAGFTDLFWKRMTLPQQTNKVLLSVALDAILFSSAHKRSDLNQNIEMPTYSNMWKHLSTHLLPSASVHIECT